jgi:hypothetical protein
MKLRLTKFEVNEEALSKDLNFFFSFPLEKIDQFLRDAGKDSHSTNSSYLRKKAQEIFGIDDEKAKNMRSTVRFLAQMLYPERLPSEEIAKDLAQLGIPEEKTVAFVNFYNQLPLTIKEELRFGAMIAQLDSVVPHWRMADYSKDLKTVYEGDEIIALLPTVTLKLTVGPISGDEEENEVIEIEMFMDEIEVLFNSLKREFDQHTLGIDQMGLKVGKLIATRPKGEK